eukprot:TRINITY_DN15848_c0_g1_i1.p1 TRINITY_DN15848_c0_g1~~TRINITY_DN15848_c0_g1_i1.p1  ORF type:complete len:124 (+),score=15.40 TRINITY_DN15848_c0_g1_i1:3-374(+)
MGLQFSFWQWFFFSSRRRHTRQESVSWARRCVQETDAEYMGHGNYMVKTIRAMRDWVIEDVHMSEKGNFKPMGICIEAILMTGVYPQFIELYQATQQGDHIFSSTGSNCSMQCQQEDLSLIHI